MRISYCSSDVCSSDLSVDIDVAEKSKLGIAIGEAALRDRGAADPRQFEWLRRAVRVAEGPAVALVAGIPFERDLRPVRSEEHTSELQSLMRISYAVFCLKKKKKNKKYYVKNTVNNLMQNIHHQYNKSRRTKTD